MKRILPLLLLLSACTGTESGNPPFNPSEEGESGVELAGIGISLSVPDGEDMPVSQQWSFPEFAERETIRITPLRGKEPAVTSSNSNLATPENQQYRLQKSVDGQRLSPVDVSVGFDSASSSYKVTELVPAKCLQVESRDFISGSDSRRFALRVRNGCADQSVNYEAPRLRLGDSYRSSSTEFSLTPLETHTLVISQDANPNEDLLLLESAQDGLVVVTLRAE